eukprot:364028-Chlamydomonas_euryale.AAC.8
MAEDQDRSTDRLFSPPGGGKPKPKHKDIRGFLVSRPRAAAEAAAEPVAAEDAHDVSDSSQPDELFMFPNRKYEHTDAPLLPK